MTDHTETRGTGTVSTARHTGADVWEPKRATDRPIHCPRPFLRTEQPARSQAAQSPGAKPAAAKLSLPEASCPAGSSTGHSAEWMTPGTTSGRSAPSPRVDGGTDSNSSPSLTRPSPAGNVRPDTSQAAAALAGSEPSGRFPPRPDCGNKSPSELRSAARPALPVSRSRKWACPFIRLSDEEVWAQFRSSCTIRQEVFADGNRCLRARAGRGLPILGHPEADGGNADHGFQPMRPILTDFRSLRGEFERSHMGGRTTRIQVQAEPTASDGSFAYLRGLRPFASNGLSSSRLPSSLCLFGATTA